jgi:alpha-beta hydrolase superfamily lysophospholipase
VIDDAPVLSPSDGARSADNQSGFFESRDGTRLYYEAQKPQGPASACVVIVHGYDDHAGRYQSLGRLLANELFSVFAFDYRGHGRAAGRRGYCRRFEDFLDDLESALSVAKDMAGPVPVVLMAQSNGALIALRWLSERGRRAGLVDAAVFCSPYLGPRFRVGWFESLALILCSRFLPALTFSNRLKPEDLTHDTEMMASRKRDSLLHGIATARWCTESNRAQRQVADRIALLAVPSLWLIGDADRVADPDISLQRYARAGGAKELRVYAGFYHELFNELGRERVNADALAWLNARYRPAR